MIEEDSRIEIDDKGDICLVGHHAEEKNHSLDRVLEEDVLWNWANDRKQIGFIELGVRIEVNSFSVLSEGNKEGAAGQG